MYNLVAYIISPQPQTESLEVELLDQKIPFCCFINNINMQMWLSLEGIG